MNDQPRHGRVQLRQTTSTRSDLLGIYLNDHLVGATAGVERARHMKIMPVRVLGVDGTSSNANITKGIVWAAAHGADVINLSLGESGLMARLLKGGILNQAIQHAHEKGAVVVAAAGNEGTGTSMAAPYVSAVAAWAGHRGCAGSREVGQGLTTPITDTRPPAAKIEVSLPDHAFSDPPSQGVGQAVCSRNGSARQTAVAPRDHATAELCASFMSTDHGFRRGARFYRDRGVPGRRLVLALDRTKPPRVRPTPRECTAGRRPAARRPSHHRLHHGRQRETQDQRPGDLPGHRPGALPRWGISGDGWREVPGSIRRARTSVTKRRLHADLTGLA